MGWVSTLSVMNSRSIGLSSSRSARLPGEQAMGHRGVNRGRSPLDQHPGRVDEGAGRDGEVVDDQRRAALDRSDQLHNFGRLGVVDPPLVGDGQWAPPGGSAQARRLLGEPSIGGDDDQISRPFAAIASQSTGHGIEVVDRHLEETLDLGSVQVQGDDPVHAGRLDRVRAHPGPDRDAWARPSCRPWRS